MIWKSSLSVFIRIVFVMALALSSGAASVLAQTTPVTVESDLAGLLPFDERNTCDPSFWNVLKDRAWEEGQREITQNNNLIYRPDSVLSMTCFDSFMDHLNNYAKHDFPGDPDESLGETGDSIIAKAADLVFPSGIFLELFVIFPDEVKYDFNAITFTQGYLMYAVLELLVLDQLVDNVPNDTASDAMRAFDLTENPTLAACASVHGGLEFKQYYIDDNFPPNMMGNRAITEAGSPAWAAISSSLDNEANSSHYNGCARMNQVWQRSKCYDFATDSIMYKNIDPTPPVQNPPGGEHDGFYSLQQYRDRAAAGGDYRTKEVMCAIPPADNAIIAPDAGEYLCQLAEHGLPMGIATWAGLQAILNGVFNTNALQTWDSAHAGANLPSGSAGAVDQYMHFLGLRDSTSCSSITPIKTGYIVIDDGVTYIDAVCPAPGCYFNPPSSLSGNGSCN